MSWEDYEKRIASIFGTEEVPDVTGATLQTYRGYLVEHLNQGLKLTGREDFPWEERYVLGHVGSEEYDELKKDNPSYKDVFELLEIIEQDEPEDDLLARVRRLSDSKIFTIGLSWLTTVDEKSSNFQLLDDFATWIANCV
jgi:hypothetical protein